MSRRPQQPHKPRATKRDPAKRIPLQPNQDCPRPHIALVGFMGAGKTVVGRALAAQLTRNFVDLDELIESETGMSVGRLFRESGEMAFRAKERACLRSTLQQETPAVIATGGGTFADKTNRKKLTERAHTIYLRTEVSTILKRLRSQDEINTRPLLKTPNPEDTIKRLLNERSPIYEHCHLSIATANKEIDEIVHEIVSTLKIAPTSHTRFKEDKLPDPQDFSHADDSTLTRNIIDVRSTTTKYSVEIRQEGGPWLSKAITALCPGQRISIITDSNVAPLYGDTLSEELSQLGKQTQLLAIPAGESSKTLATVNSLYHQLIADGIERSDAIVALGGGVVGDISGFVASTFLRGISFVQVPTTTLAAVDASVGGKTGINTEQGKNLIGTFYPPRGVLVSLNHLSSQTRDAHAAGLVESLKMAVTMDANLFDVISSCSAQLLNYDPNHLLDVITRSIQLKAQIVSQDERESNVRAVLNYGHTVGHAIEVAERYELAHGAAVALGMLAEAEWAEIEGYSSRVSKAIHTVLENLGLNTDWPKAHINYDALALDKKRMRSALRCPVVPVIGRYELKVVPISSLTRFLQRRSTQ